MTIPRRATASVRLSAFAHRSALAALCGLFASCAGEGTGPDDDALVLRLVAGASQIGVEGALLSESVTVRLEDASGRPVSGRWIRFTVVDGGGEVGDGGVTDLRGVVHTPWRMGTPGPQQLRVTVDRGGPVWTVDATAVPVHEADVVVIRGATEPVRGVLLLEVADAQLRIVREEIEPDTILRLPPMSAPGIKVLVFFQSRPPLQVSPAWTSAPDTVVLVPPPPVALNVEVVVRHGDYETMRRNIEDRLAFTESTWSHMGLVLGDVEWLDRTGADGGSHLRSAPCVVGAASSNTIQLSVVETVNGSTQYGFACHAGYIYLAGGGLNFPYLLAHEFGHVFSLEHTPTGLMHPTAASSGISDGEIYWAHFSVTSFLNHRLDSQPANERRACGNLTSVARPACLPIDYNLGGLRP